MTMKRPVLWTAAAWIVTLFNQDCSLNNLLIYDLLIYDPEWRQQNVMRKPIAVSNKKICLWRHCDYCLQVWTLQSSHLDAAMPYVNSNALNSNHSTLCETWRAREIRRIVKRTVNSYNWKLTAAADEEMNTASGPNIKLYGCHNEVRTNGDGLKWRVGRATSRPTAGGTRSIRQTTGRRTSADRRRRACDRFVVP